MAIYVTGDMHGNWKARLTEEKFPEQSGLSKQDYLIICGDFGLFHDDEAEWEQLDWLEARPFTTLFVDGNHENFDRLDAFPVEDWHGGKVHKVRPSIIHLMRGGIFDIEGKTFFAFGGARSHDIQDGILDMDDPHFEEKCYNLRRFRCAFRINHLSWWEQEMPSKEEMEHGLQNLRDHGNRVDYILTHSPTSTALHQLDRGNPTYKADRLTDYLQEIQYSVKFQEWFFGHMHVDKKFPFAKMHALYKDFVRIL